MGKLIVKYVLYIAFGAVLGVLMQLMPQLQGQWSQNLFTYMATDLGIWAVICILMATYAESPLHSGFQCFACMAAMVAAYYALFPESVFANIRWIVLAVLIFPIGIVIYRYREKTWIMAVLELFFVGALVLDILSLASMLGDGAKMIINTAEGAVFADVTPFAIGNYILLVAFTAFGMLYVALKYRQKKQERN